MSDHDDNLLAQDKPGHVWIVEGGCYSDRWLGGAYWRLADAIADNPKGTWEGETCGGQTHWDNGLDWEEARVIYLVKIQGTKPVPESPNTMTSEDA